MFSIGDFARHGRVSVRMLRHYHATGLLEPAEVDEATGYRWYDARQFGRLNRIVALKDLGFTLDQVDTILDEKVSVDELRGMLMLRKAELQTQIMTDSARLAHVEARLRTIEREGALPMEDVQIKRIPAVRVAEVTGAAAGFEPEFITPVIQPLYDELVALLDQAGVTPTGPAIAYYEGAADSDKVIVHAALPVDTDAGANYPFTIVDLPELEQAATILHRGPMDSVLETVQSLAGWMDTHGYRSLGYNRELYLNYGCDENSDAWVTELQEPVARA